MQASLSTSAKPIFLGYANIDPPKDSGFDLYSKGEKKVLNYSNDLMEFSGTSTESFSKYLIGIKDGDSILLKEFIPVEIAGRLKVQREGKRIMKSLESRNSLGEEFGSKKKRKEIKAKEVNKVNSVLGIDNIAIEIKDSSPASSPTKQVFSLLVPDSAATRKDLVYDLWEIIPKGDYNSLNIDYLMQYGFDDLKKELEILKLTSYVLNKLEAAHRGKDEKLFKMGLYMGFLMKFYRLRDKEINPDSLGTSGLKGASPEIIDTLINKFTEYSVFNGLVKYRTSSQLKDKILACIGVIALHMDDFNTDINMLISDLGISITKMVKIYKELGVRIQVVKKSKMAVLTLPLVFTSPKKY